MDNWLTTQQAADKLGVTQGRIRQMIVDGQLPTQKFGHVHMIKESDLKLVEDRPKAGRPPKAKDEKVKVSKKKSSKK